MGMKTGMSSDKERRNWLLHILQMIDKYQHFVVQIPKTVMQEFKMPWVSIITKLKRHNPPEPVVSIQCQDDLVTGYYYNSTMAWRSSQYQLTFLSKQYKGRIIFQLLPARSVWPIHTWALSQYSDHLSWARFLSLARSKFRLFSVNHEPGYWSNLSCD